MVDAVLLTRALAGIAEADASCLEFPAVPGDQAGDEVRAETAKRLSRSLAAYGGAIKRMLDLGDTLTAIAGLTGLEINELRMALPYAP